MTHLLAQHHIACLKLSFALYWVPTIRQTTVHILYSIFLTGITILLKLPDVLNLSFIIFHKDLPHSAFINDSIQALLPHPLESVRCNEGQSSLGERGWVFIIID